jgi:uncharacterized damage-inducible protein DinB
MADFQPDQAVLLFQALLPQIKREHRTTTKVIRAVPVEQGGYKPHPESMSAFELSWHVVSAEIFFLAGAVAGELSKGQPRPESVRDSAGVADWYTENFARWFEEARNLDGERLVRRISFHGYDQSALGWLQFMVSHSIHHRGQLTVYLRPMGGRVPAMHE